MGQEDPHGASDDCDQLVHVPSCLLVPNVRLFSSESSRVHPGGLLHQRHYFQVRSWPGYLSDLVRQVGKESSLAINDELALDLESRAVSHDRYAQRSCSAPNGFQSSRPFSFGVSSSDLSLARG